MSGPDVSAYTVQAAQAPAAFDVRLGMDGVRSTFAGVVQPSGAFVGAPESPGFAAAAPIASQVQRDMAGLTAPTSLAWNRFALDFAASAAAPSLAGR